MNNGTPSCNRCRCLGWSAGILTLLLGAGLWSAPWWLGIDCAPMTPVDYLIVLGGDQQRALWAARLYLQGIAPKIIVSGRGDALLNRKVLLDSGVPASAIQLETESATTYENAQFSGNLLRKAGAIRVALVTSWFHSSRALATFRHVNPGMDFLSFPAEPAGNRIERKDARWEVVKRLGYLVRHGVPLEGFLKSRFAPSKQKK